MREKLYELIKDKGSFNGDIMGCDTYVVFIDDLVDSLLEFLKGNGNE